jgi:hypothetical protein
MVDGGAGLLSFTHIDATMLTIGANKSVSKGASVSVATRVTDGGTGSGIANASVGLWRHLSSGGGWTLVATKTTTGSGATAATVTVTKSAQYQWRFAGSFVHDKGVSAIQSITAK